MVTILNRLISISVFTLAHLAIKKIVCLGGLFLRSSQYISNREPLLETYLEKFHIMDMEIKRPKDQSTWWYIKKTSSHQVQACTPFNFIQNVKFRFCMYFYRWLRQSRIKTFNYAFSTEIIRIVFIFLSFY